MVLPSAARVGLARMDTASANGTSIDVGMVMAFPSGVGDGAASDLGQHDRGHLQAMNLVSVGHRCFNRMSCEGLIVSISAFGLAGKFTAPLRSSTASQTCGVDSWELWTVGMSKYVGRDRRDAGAGLRRNNTRQLQYAGAAQ